MKEAEKYYRQVNDLPIEELPELGDGDKLTIELMENYHQDQVKSPNRFEEIKRFINLLEEMEEGGYLEVFLYESRNEIKELLKYINNPELLK